MAAAVASVRAGPSTWSWSMHPKVTVPAGRSVDWGLPVEVPHRVLAGMVDDGDQHAVVVRNGVVLHAPGELELGRTTRLASRAQRRALRALYSTCAIPGCPVRFDRCKLHHVVWWRHGGRTDLENLLPVCAVIIRRSTITAGSFRSGVIGSSRSGCPTAASATPARPAVGRPEVRGLSAMAQPST